MAVELVNQMPWSAQLRTGFAAALAQVPTETVPQYRPVIIFSTLGFGLREADVATLSRQDWPPLLSLCFYWAGRPCTFPLYFKDVLN